MRDLSDSIVSNLEGPATKPVYLVSMEFGAMPELLSATGSAVVFDGADYGGYVNVDNIANSQSARLSVPATASRVADLQNGTWRGGYCKLYAVPAVPNDGNSYTVAESVLVLDGTILSAKSNANTVQIDVIHKNLAGRFSPGNLFDAVCNHLPAPSTVLVWESERLVLERVK